jgi:hypothetical protein
MQNVFILIWNARKCLSNGMLVGTRKIFWSKDKWARDRRPNVSRPSFVQKERRADHGPVDSGLKAQYRSPSPFWRLCPSSLALALLPNQTLHRGGGYIKASPDQVARVLRSSHSPPPPRQLQALQHPELPRPSPTMVSEFPPDSISRRTFRFHLPCCRC